MTDLPDRESAPVLYQVAKYFLIVLASFSFGLWSCIQQNGVFHAFAEFVETVNEVAVQTQNNTVRPVLYLQPARRPGEGVTVNKVGDDGNLVLMTSFWDGQTEIRLMRRDGTIVAKWPVLHSSFFPDKEPFGDRAPATDRNVDLHGAVMNPDGSLVFNFEYSGAVKLSRCGDLEWALPLPTHHSVEKSESGGYWIPGRRFIRKHSTNPDEQFEPFNYTQHDGPLLDDMIMKVSEDGKVIEKKSVMRIFYDNGLQSLMTGTGDNFQSDAKARSELVHMNKVTELPAAYASAFPMFKAGDLLISLRQHNMIAVIDPDGWKLKWYKVGPFIRQHDPEWRPDGTITLFNNNSYRTSFAEKDTIDPTAPLESEIVSVDPKTGSTRVIYGHRPGQEFSSIIRGKIDPSPHGGYLVTEFEGGRAFEFDAKGQIIWDYMNRYDKDTVAEITGARLYPESYFTVKDWTCPKS